MTRHTHDGGHLVDGFVDYDYVVHHPDAEPGLLVVTGVPAAVCRLCDEHWFDDAVGFDLSRTLRAHEPGPGQVRTVSWFTTQVA
jgi:hypothetical protein